MFQRPTQHGKLRLGMTVTLTPTASRELAGIPARVIAVWPRFRSGDYLVTLEYDQAVKLQQQFIQHIDAFMSELEPCAPSMVKVSRSGGSASTTSKPLSTFLYTLLGPSRSCHTTPSGARVTPSANGDRTKGVVR